MRRPYPRPALEQVMVLTGLRLDPAVVNHEYRSTSIRPQIASICLSDQPD